MRRLLRDQAGVAVVEFALAAPLLFGMMLTVVEGTRYFWVRQVVQHTASASARCMAVEWATAGTRCATKAQLKTTAIGMAASSSVAVRVVDTDIDPSGDCYKAGQPKVFIGMRKVTVHATFSSPIGGLIPSIPTDLSSSACFPAMT